MVNLNDEVTHVLKILPDSEAEEYFIKDIMPLCKDKVAVRLGAIWGMDWNEYVVTHEDYLRVGKQLKELRGY